MLNDSQLNSYLARLGYQGTGSPDADTLFALHELHLRKIPFENLDIALGDRIVLSDDAVLEKLIQRGRGGFCYELNYAFHLLLRTLGIEVTLVSANVWNGTAFGPDFDHMLLAAKVQNTTYIADVGFGECFRTPLALKDGAETEALGIRYRLTSTSADQWLLSQSKCTKEWIPEYSFSTQRYDISDFRSMCDYQQTSPNSHFTKKTVCSMATLSGRETLSNSRWITTHHQNRTEREIGSEAQYRELLGSVFRMTLPDDANVGALMRR